MSIYPVRLSEWFPVNDEYFQIISSIIDCSRCEACGSKIRFKAAVGHHSLMVGVSSIWCSWKCCHSGKIAKPDWRRDRRYRRKLKKDNRGMLHCWADLDRLIEDLKSNILKNEENI
jgi:hypothetical protein